MLFFFFRYAHDFDANVYDCTSESCSEKTVYTIGIFTEYYDDETIQLNFRRRTAQFSKKG
jgi:hypothetical protein